MLYTYFAEMARLRTRLGDDFLGRLELARPRCDPPREGLRRFLRHLLDVFASSPGHVQVLATQRVVGPPPHWPSTRRCSSFSRTPLVTRPRSPRT